jgi:energy-coupling factor transport system substrate-specific component
VSWPLGSFLVVGLTLAIGWLAYERARPSARMVAVVGTLAAVAALGRDAFVALPDVKPITAMTLVVGYALGPLPGFTVGALGMLASNVLLGQGPYTPWQMAAWGSVGLAGAALGRLSGRRLGRLPLAVACALAAFAAKEVMNLYTWTLGASHTPAAFLAVAGSALPFDLTDAIASLLFGFAFGPELARLLARMRARMHVSWEPAEPPARADRPAAGNVGRRSLGPAASFGIALLAGALLLGGPRAAGARSGPVRARGAPAGPRAGLAGPRAAEAGVAVSREVSFLAGAQNADGGFGAARGQSSSELYSGWVAMGLAAVGHDPLSLRRGGHTILDALRGEASSLQGAGDLERTILALHACGASVHSLAGADPVAELLRYRARDGSFGDLSNITAFAIFALRAAGYQAANPILSAAGRWLARQQDADGGFGFGPRGGGSDVDDTAAALQGLADAGMRSSASVARAAGFLVRAQNLDGGYPQEHGGESNAQSTAWAIQGLVAAGRNPRTVTRAGSRSPLAYLESLVAGDGSVRYSRTGTQTPVWVTAQALIALAERPFPIGPERASAPRASAHPAALPAGRPRGAGRAGRSASGAGAHARAAGPDAAGAGTSKAQSRGLDALARAMGALVGVALTPVIR